MGVATQVTMRVLVTTPLTVTLSLASELEPPPLPGTLTGMLLWSGTSFMRLTRLSARWKGSDDLSDGWMTLHMCKRRCKPPSTHRPIFKLGGGAGCPGMSPYLSHFIPSFSSYLVTCLASCTAAVIMSTSMDCFH
jgi:hypothetical protein